MQKTMSPFILPAALLLGATLALSGCGRKGDLDVPGQAQPAPKVKPGEKAKVPERPFLLDPLL